MLDRIKACLPSLAPAEQRVAQLVLSDPRAFANLPVTELASRALVSKPTVIRFCRSVGYDGLSDFKLKLAGSVSEGVPFIHRSVDADDKTGDVLVKVIDNTVAAFLKYRNDASSVSIEKAVQVLAATYQTGRRIEFFGVGNSGIVAQDAQHKFFRLGVHSIAYSDGHLQVMSASLLKPGDCVVIISNSGRTRDLMDAEDIARKNGATTIVITASVATACSVDASTRSAAVPPVIQPPAVNPTIMVKAAAPTPDHNHKVLVGLYSPQFFIISLDIAFSFVVVGPITELGGFHSEEWSMQSTSWKNLTAQHEIIVLIIHIPQPV